MKKVPNAIDREIGKRIKARRVLLGHNQQYLAEMVGVSYQQIQKYENGTDRVGASRLFAISKALDVAVSFFFEQDLEPDAKPSAEDELENQFIRRTLASEEGRALILTFGRIRDPQMRAKVLELAELLSDARLPSRPRSASGRGR
jgi:transcriptional regulator with XRE-family HTH domain